MIFSRTSSEDAKVHTLLLTVVHSFMCHLSWTGTVFFICVYFWLSSCVCVCVCVCKRMCSVAPSQLLSYVWVSATPWTVACLAPLLMEFSRQENTGAGCHFLLQGIFPTRGWSMVYHSSHCIAFWSMQFTMHLPWPLPPSVPHFSSSARLSIPGLPFVSDAFHQTDGSTLFARVMAGPLEAQRWKWACISCLSRCILYHGATCEALA